MTGGAIRQAGASWALSVLVTTTIGVAALSIGALAPAAHAQPVPPPVLVVAHRGASAAAPEHTGPAYDRAVRAGADVLECDLQLTADEQLVCIHDATVDRTTGGAAVGAVDSFTLTELREMDFGSWFGPEFAGARVVTLEEQISCYRAVDPTVQYYIETKTQPDADRVMETRLVELLDRLDVIPEFPGPLRSSPVIIQSFDAESLRTIRELAPELPTALLFSVPTPEIDAGTLPDVDALAPNAAVLAARPDLVATAHAEGKEVHTWTVDDPARMGALIAAGVDGFFTNDPATARTVVDQAGRGSGRSTIEVTDTDAPSAVDACAAGMGIGLTAADLGASPPAPEVDTDDDELVLWPLAVGAGVLVAVLIVVRIVRNRKVGT